MHKNTYDPLTKKFVWLYRVSYRGTHKVPFGYSTVIEAFSRMKKEQFSLFTSTVEFVEFTELLVFGNDTF